MSATEGDATRRVAFRNELQEALEPSRGVLRASPFVAVRQEQRQARRLPPLRLTGGDELVDDDLRAVEEVAVLRFPQNERAGLLSRVSVFETHAGIFGERAIAYLEGGLPFGEMLQRNPNCVVAADRERRRGDD